MVRVAIGQFGPVADTTANLAAIGGLAAEARAQSADLLVLPEEAMLLAEAVPGPLHEIVENEWAAFVSELSRLARRHGLSLIAGGYEPNGTERPNNTVVALDPAGETVALYRKLHLYDAFAYRESAYVTPGSQLPPVVELAGLRVGLVNCYDIRFPELARHLVQQGADLLAVSAAWVDGPHKEDHWVTLARARAIENTVWVAASGSTSDECLGRSMILDPLGTIVADLGRTPTALAVAEVSLERTAQVRQSLPALDNRRIALSYRVTEPA